MDGDSPCSADGDGRHPTPRPSSDACLICGALGLPGDGHALALDGQSHQALDLWIAHCAARNLALQVAASALTANIALARALAAWSRARGELDAAARIEAEARFEAHCYEQIHEMLEGLGTTDPPPLSQVGDGQPDRPIEPGTRMPHGRCCSAPRLLQSSSDRLADCEDQAATAVTDPAEPEFLLTTLARWLGLGPESAAGHLQQRQAVQRQAQAGASPAVRPLQRELIGP